MVSITGSVRAGIEVAHAAADGLKRVHLELGGKAPVVVFDDADIEAAAEAIAIAGYFNAGQDCTAATRVLVARSRLAAVTEAIVAATRKVKLGMPFEAGTEVGPLICREQRERVMGFVKRAKGQGARVLTGGKIPAAFPSGYFYEPTVITDVDQKSEVVQKEIFGPVLVIQAFDSEQEALAMANDVAFGLAE